MGRSLALLILLFPCSCSSSQTTTTSDAGDAGGDAPVECNLVTDDCRPGNRCTEIRVGDACGSLCFADKGGTATQGMACPAKEDCAKGYACAALGDAGFTCARYCNDDSVCTGGTKCYKASKWTIGSWNGGMCFLL